MHRTIICQPFTKRDSRLIDASRRVPIIHGRLNGSTIGSLFGMIINDQYHSRLYRVRIVEQESSVIHDKCFGRRLMPSVFGRVIYAVLKIVVFKTVKLYCNKFSLVMNQR